MKNLLLAILLLAGNTFAQAPQKYLVTDPAPAGVTHCGVVLDTQAKVTVPVTAVTTAPAGNICQYNVTAFLNGAAAGPHQITATWIAIDPKGIFPPAESAPSVPFALDRPGTPSSPGGLAITATPRT